MLDESVAACYGWPRPLAQDTRPGHSPRPLAQDDVEIVRRLTALNKEITEGRCAYDPFAAVDDPT